MSRITRAPFYKPSLYDFPKPTHPLSPPDTEVESLPPMNLVSREPSSTDLSMSSYTKVDPNDSYTGLPVDASTPTSRFRRPSSLAYVHSGPSRDVRQAPRSATRYLIVVVPPPAVSREYTSATFLSHTSRSLESSGVLIPLLPSLSGQLNTIAREFSFPSTSGICIYLQIADSGMQFSPRVSDESWPILWGNVFEERQQMNLMGGLPIAGRIEFDLDLRKARWFDAWVSACRRDSDAGLSRPPSVANHRREESRTTSTQDQLEDSLVDDVSVTIQHRVPVSRLVPRKLSLLERVDAGPQRSLSRPASRSGLAPLHDTSNVLTPVAQANYEPEDEEDEPRTAIQRVEKKVETWRASSSFERPALATATGQTALDPANMPNSLPLDFPSDPESPEDVVMDAEGGQTLNLDDFAWSISSAGPPSGPLEPDSAYLSDWSRVPSVHLAQRLEGSVCLTPSTCTSFGPPDYDPLSPVSSLISRLPSPDIAARCIDDCPPTPSTATSWGAPSEWPESPVAPFRAPSVDIAMRHMDSRPVTPSTATSWGAPLSYPPSPITPYRVRTPDIGQIVFDEEDEEPRRPPTWNLVWPYVQNGRAEPWRHVWPYQTILEPESTPIEQSVVVDTSSEYAVINVGGWDLFEAYQTVLTGERDPAVYPNFDLYPAKPQAFAEVKEVSMKIEAKYPTISLYPAVYPSFEIYPGHFVAPQETAVKILPVKLAATYPMIELYPVAYPSFEIYPGHVVAPQETLAKVLSAKLVARYPAIEIYSTVYPSFEIYPGHVVAPQEVTRKVQSVKLIATYPAIEIYSPVYPHLVIYPTIFASDLTRTQPSSTRPFEKKNAASSRRPLSKEVTIKLRPHYPRFDLYPSVYPENLKEIYPSAFKTDQVDNSMLIEVKLPAAYPYFNLYPAVYPHFDLYPIKATLSPGSQSLAVISSEEVVYPYFDLYPAVSGGVAQRTLSYSKPESEVVVKLELKYPCIELYPPVYPHLCIYPSLPSPPVERTVSISCEPCYPYFDLYPAVYPYFDIYRSGSATCLEDWREPRPVQLKAKYPTLAIYPPVYPFFDIYNTGTSSDLTPLTSKLSVSLEARYPVFDIYPAVYPHFNIYPATQQVITLAGKSRQMRKTHRELHEFIRSQQTEQVSHRHPRRTHKELHDLVFAQRSLSVRTTALVPDVPVDASPVSSSSSSAGVPMIPSEVRRAVSLGRVAQSRSLSDRSLSRNASLRQLSPVEELQVRLHRRSDSSNSHDGESRGDTSPIKRKARRDSIVLEKARHWGATLSQAEQPSRLTLNDLSEFPMPPRPLLPTGRPASDINRPISKLDKSKFPFH